MTAGEHDPAGHMATGDGPESHWGEPEPDGDAYPQARPGAGPAPGAPAWTPTRAAVIVLGVVAALALVGGVVIALRPNHQSSPSAQPRTEQPFSAQSAPSPSGSS